MQSNMRTAITILFATFALCLVPTAQAAQCSNGGIAGDWGFTSMGSVVLPTGTIPFGAVGRITFDVAGNITGSQTASVNGQVTPETIKGTIDVHADCRATATVSIFEGGTLVRTTGLRAVFVANQTEFRVIFASVALPTGGSLPTVITIEGKRLF
jgi:hypothetical protein